MADNIEELTFSNSVFSGDVTIDFTTNNLLSGEISGTVGQYTTGFSSFQLRLGDDGQGGYTLNGIGGKLSSETLTFSGLDPSSISGSVYIQATGTSSASDQPITVTPVLCFASGTSIRTAKGGVAVERLQVGDRAITFAGAERAVVWTGCREITCEPEAWPVRITAGAFGAGLPERDLLLSPGHPVLVGDHLVPIMCLINGTTVDRLTVDRITYWHVELDAHDILLAEGLPAESYIDLGSRPWFDGVNSPLHHPDLVLVGECGRCRPVAVVGPVVVAERRRLDAVFSATLAGHCKWHPADAFGWLTA